MVEACRQLADELVKAWYAHKLVPTDIPPDEDEVLYARRLVAQRCLYGVDKNEMAVDLAKLSLWLVTLAKDHPFTFLDHSLRHGDSLVGLTRKQIIGFHWEPKKQKQFGEDLIQKRLDRATEARAKILNAREDVPYRDQEQRLALADEALNVVRMTGDACISTFFAGKKAKEREKLCEELFLDVARHFQVLKEDKFDVEARSRIAHAAASLRTGANPIPPFHWEIELPEVFSRENGGFDAFVGNPPFLGGTRISTEFGMNYFQWLTSAYAPAGHLCDLVAYFFRRAFTQISDGGTLGLIATNTIAQGDTREGGLRCIIAARGQIYRATRRYKWPGGAQVIVSVVHIRKALTDTPILLDSESVSRISAFLLKGNVDDKPHLLSSNPVFSLGSKIYGQGFLFADDDVKSTPLAQMETIIVTNPRCANRIKPYLVGEEINSDPFHKPQRYVIYLSDVAQVADLNEWPELEEIVRQKVKPEREKLGENPNNTPLKRKWWAYQAHRPEFYAAVEGLERVLNQRHE